MDLVSYALSKKYVEDTAEALGAVKGAPCTIKSTETSQDGKSTIITFSWMSNTTPSVEQTTQITVRNGTIVSVNPILNHGTKIAEITIDGTQTNLYAPAGGGGGGEPAELTDDLDVTRTVGGISNGRHYDDGTPLETILRDMLNPIDYPTLTDPSATLSATGNKLLEKGSSLNSTMTVTFSRGSIHPAYTTSGYRSGPAESYALNDGITQSGNTFSVVVTESLLSYQATVNYEQGEQPKDSAGNNYSSPLPEGSVHSNTINYEFVDALWANTSNITTIAKLALISKTTKQKDFNFPAQTIANPEVFDVPASWNVTAVQVKNDLSGIYEDAGSQFTITSITHDDAAGNTVNYNRYTFNLGYDTGARSVRIKWS